MIHSVLYVLVHYSWLQFDFISQGSIKLFLCLQVCTQRKRASVVCTTPTLYTCSVSTKYQINLCTKQNSILNSIHIPSPASRYKGFFFFLHIHVYIHSFYGMDITKVYSFLILLNMHERTKVENGKQILYYIPFHWFFSQTYYNIKYRNMHVVHTNTI